MSTEFAPHATRFTEDFYLLIQPNNPLVQEVVKEVVVEEPNDVADLLVSIARAISVRFQYDTDLNIWGVVEHWAPPDELMYSDRADCDDMCLFASSVLFALGIPHNLVIGWYDGSIGHVWLEVSDDRYLYIFDPAGPVVRLIPHETDYYADSPYTPIERVLVT